MYVYVCVLQDLWSGSNLVECVTYIAKRMYVWCIQWQQYMSQGENLQTMYFSVHPFSQTHCSKVCQLLQYNDFLKWAKNVLFRSHISFSDLDPFFEVTIQSSKKSQEVVLSPCWRCVDRTFYLPAIQFLDMSCCFQYRVHAFFLSCYFTFVLFMPSIKCLCVNTAALYSVCSLPAQPLLALGKGISNLHMNCL